MNSLGQVSHNEIEPGVLNSFCLLVPSVDNLCNQFGVRSGPKKLRVRSGSKLFEALTVFLKRIFRKSGF